MNDLIMDTRHTATQVKPATLPSAATPAIHMPDAAAQMQGAENFGHSFANVAVYAPPDAPVIQRSPLKGIRRWLGKNTPLIIGKAGREGHAAAQAAAAPAAVNAPAAQPAAAAPYAVGANGPTEEQLEQHQKAYREARTYHQVKFPDSAVPDSDVPGDTVKESIRRQGLLTKYGGTGNSAQFRDSGYQEESRGKIHLGRDLKKRDVPTYGDAMIRPILPKNRTAFHHWDEDDAPQDELFRDRDHPGYGVTTREDIGPESIMFGSNRDMLNGRNSSTILGNLATHYPGAQPPSEDYLRVVHQKAIDDGYISDEAGDNMSEEEDERL